MGRDLGLNLDDRQNQYNIDYCSSSSHNAWGHADAEECTTGYAFG